jgi:hypothetical protein
VLIAQLDLRANRDGQFLRLPSTDSKVDITAARSVSEDKSISDKRIFHAGW